MKHYELFSTTADVGMIVRGDDYAKIYGHALQGLNRLVFGVEPSLPPGEILVLYPFIYDGDSCENVLINFLNEILYLVYTRLKIAVDINMVEAGEKRLNCTLKLAPLMILPEIEIKSVTYHDLRVIEQKGQKVVRIVFDI